MLRRILLVSLATAVLCPVAPLLSAQETPRQKHPFTFEDMMALKRVEEPEVSPDGKWVLFAAVDVDLKANTKTPHVWVVPLQARAGPSTAENDSQANHSASLGMTESREKEIVSDQDADRPRWAPDGKRFAFVSTKENGSQIWIADFDGSTGTVTRKYLLTNIATEADGELWSPDGKNILFKSDVYPECDGRPAEETTCNAKNVEQRKNSKVKALIFTHLLYRHWNAYKEGKRTHLFVISLIAPLPAGLPANTDVDYRTINFPRDLTPGDYDAPVFSLGGQDDYAFSPDGQEICYASNHDPEPAISTNNDLFTVPVNFPADATSKDVLAATKDVTAENKAADNTPLYSPDGKYIAYRAQQRPGYESDRWRLMLYGRNTGEKKNLAENFDRWVETISWLAGHEIIFTAEDQGAAPIYSVYPELCPNGCHPIKLVDGYNDDLTVAHVDRVNPSGNDLWDPVLLFTRMSSDAPTQVFAGSPNCAIGLEKVTAMLRGEPVDIPHGCSPPLQGQQLTHLNDSVLSQISMSPLESFWFTGAHNEKVQGWLIKPPNFDP
ncbi:MAG TPA: hypothetical protein VGL74_13850, partial [Terriglobales bacterium]